MIRKIIAVIAILVPCSIAAVWMSAQQSMPGSVPPPPPTMLVDVIHAQSTTLQIKVKAQGTVTPRTQTTLVSEVSGLITEVSSAFVAGGFFSKGDILIKIDDRNYLAEVKRAEASVASAQTNVTREAGLANYAEADWQRAKSLLSAGKTATDLALRKPQLAEAMANLDFAQAELDRRRGDLDRTVIRAPYDGMVRRKRADIGQYVAAGTQLAEIFAVDIAEVRLPLPDRELPYLNLPDGGQGDGPEVELKAEIGGVEHTWRGRIVRTEGVFDERSRVLYLVAQVVDPYNRHGQKWPSPLRIGTFVEASIAGRIVENIIKLPRRVLRGDNEVWTVDDESKLVVNKVDLLRADEKSIYIKAGINEGDVVCLTLLDNPLPGTPVRYNLSTELSEVTLDGGD